MTDKAFSLFNCSLIGINLMLELRLKNKTDITIAEELSLTNTHTQRVDSYKHLDTLGSKYVNPTSSVSNVNTGY